MMALELWLIAAVVVAAVMVGERAIDRARAQVGADAVALAVAGGGDGSEIASANGVVVERITTDPSVDVIVRSGTATAAARAQRTRLQWTGLDPRVRAALARAERIVGGDIPIVSGLRSRSDQERLWANRHRNPYPVAPPGTSLHELGLAVAVPLGVARVLGPISASASPCR